MSNQVTDVEERQLAAKFVAAALTGLLAGLGPQAIRVKTENVLPEKDFMIPNMDDEETEEIISSANYIGHAVCREFIKYNGFVVVSPDA